MSAATFLHRLVDVLDAAAIPYMVAGSFASTFHGMVRATQDVDVVGILRAMGDRLDRPYLDRWAADLGLTDGWVEAQRAAYAKDA